MWYFAIGYSVDEFCSIFDDSSFFISFSNHITCGIVDKNEWNIILVRKLDKLSSFIGRFRKYDSVIGEDSYWIIMYFCPSRY